VNAVLTNPNQSGESESGGPTRASDNTVYLLRSRIFTGQYEAGEKLPTERQLADQLGTSRITVRAALKELEAFGFVLARIGSRGGWWVVDPGSLATCWRNWMHSNSHQIEAMLECGETIESEIAAFAASRATADDIQTLETLLAHMKAAASSLGPHFAFHQALAKACGNRYLGQSMLIVANQIFLPSDRVMAGDMEEFYAGHEAIVAAIGDRDPERAREALKRHHRFSRHVMEVEA
jgi:GntR family transcriptional regulator, transcriptional repressor for pyruvate dehydrogenase complex